MFDNLSIGYFNTFLKIRANKETAQKSYKVFVYPVRVKNLNMENQKRSVYYVSLYITKDGFKIFMIIHRIKSLVTIEVAGIYVTMYLYTIANKHLA